MCVEVECCCIIWRYLCQAPLLRLMTCSERDIIIAVHSNGVIEWRACNIVEDEKGKTVLNYELLYAGETQRQTQHCRISAAALCPITQTTVALLYNSGNISIYQLVGRFFSFDIVCIVMNFFLQVHLIRNFIQMHHDKF